MSLKEQYELLKAKYEHIKALDEAAYKVALSEKEYIDVDGNRVTSKDMAWNLNNFNFEKLLKRVDEIRRKMGMNLPYDEYPHIEPWNLSIDIYATKLIKLEDEIIEKTGKLIESLKEDIEKVKTGNPDLRKRFIETALKLEGI